MWYDSFTCVTWLIHMCDMTHSYVWHDSFMCVTWLIHMCDMTHSLCDMTHSCVWHDSFICVTWLIHMCDMTHSYVRHDSFTYARLYSFTCVICVCMRDMCYLCGATHACVCHDSFIRVTWRICMCCMTHSYVCHDLFTYVWHDQLVRMCAVPVGQCPFTHTPTNIQTRTHIYMQSHHKKIFLSLSLMHTLSRIHTHYNYTNTRTNIYLHTHAVKE